MQTHKKKWTPAPSLNGFTLVVVLLQPCVFTSGDPGHTSGGPLNRCQEKILYAAIYKRGLAKHASVDIIKEVEVAMASTLFSEVFLQTLKVHVEREIVADGVFFFFFK